MSGRTVAVDFDGVLHPYTKGWIGLIPEDEPPTDGAEGFLQELAAEGYRIVVFSCRAREDVGRRGIVQWLRKWDLLGLVTDVTHVKVPAVAYIDDRAVHFDGDWFAARQCFDRLVKPAGATLADIVRGLAAVYDDAGAVTWLWASQSWADGSIQASALMLITAGRSADVMARVEQLTSGAVI